MELVRSAFELLEHREDPGWRPDHKCILSLSATEGSLYSVLPLIVHEQAKLIGLDLSKVQTGFHLHPMLKCTVYEESTTKLACKYHC